MINDLNMKRNIFYRLPLILICLQSFHCVLPFWTNVCSASEKIGKAITAQQTWPIFRGNQGLTGRVDKIPLNIIPLWQFRSESPIESGAAIGYGKIFFGNSGGKLFALNQDSGEKIWELSTDTSIVAAPLLPPDQKNPFLFVGGSDGTFLAIKAMTGEIVWRFDCGARITSSATYFYENNQMRIVFGAYDFKLHCLDALTGKELWTIETENFINGTPALSGDFLVFGGCDSFLRVINILQAAPSQVIDLDSYLPSSPALEKETAWVANYDGEIFSVDIGSSKILWKYHDENSGSFLSPLAIASIYLVAADDDGRILVLDKKTGEKQCVLTVSGQVSSGPIVDEKNVLIADEDGFLTVFELGTGKEISRFEHGPAILAPLAISDTRIYVGDNDGNLTVYAQSKGREDEG